MFPDYRVKTAFQHGKGVIDKKVPFKNNKRLKKNIIYRLFRNTADPKGASKQSFKKGSLSNFGVLKCLCTPGEDMH